MQLQLFFNLVAAGCGVVAGFCFCVGSAFTNLETMANLCESSWGYSPAQAKAQAAQSAQSAQYLVGAVFLLTSFVCQVAAALMAPISRIALPSVLASPYVMLLVVIIPSAIASWAAASGLAKYREPRLLEELKRRHP